jgi:diaminopimelate epimerase
VRAIPVVKMSGTGNDFLMIDNRKGLLKETELAKFAQDSCPRRISAGADGVILIEEADKPGHQYRMRIFNADGSEAEMCGNGSRCIAVFAKQLEIAGENQVIQTMAGTLNASVAADGKSAKVQLSEPQKMVINARVPALGEKYEVYFLNTGVPHAVIFVKDVAAVDVKNLGAAIRYHEVFKPKGTNANFVQLMGNNTIKVRTYERGVEDETMACGTGSTACAIVTGLLHGYKSPVKVNVASGDVLGIHFKLKPNEQSSERPFLEGAVKTVYKGEFYW